MGAPYHASDMLGCATHTQCLRLRMMRAPCLRPRTTRAPCARGRCAPHLRACTPHHASTGGSAQAGSRTGRRQRHANPYRATIPTGFTVAAGVVQWQGSGVAGGQWRDGRVVVQAGEVGIVRAGGSMWAGGTVAAWCGCHVHSMTHRCDECR
jgi:hypothetical protein